MSAVGAIIRQEIERAGPISFAQFMELALYCPKLGYYERRGAGIGRRGDFYTSVSVGCLFGELLAFQCAHWLAELPGGPWQIVEAGAHQCQLAADMLAWLRRQRPATMERLEYWIIEPSLPRQSWQRARLEEFAGSVRWWPSFEALPHPVQGVILSNELLDAFPFRRLGWDAAGRRWFEWRVGLAGEQLVWERAGIEPGAMEGELQAAGFDLPSELLAVLPDAFTLDLSPQAGRWWQRAAGKLQAGRLLTLDYGLTAQELLQPERGRGTARAVVRHHAVDDLLANPGEQDLTAHVNFTQLQRAGEAAGLRTEGLFTQAQFLTSMAQRASEPAANFGEWTLARRRQLQTLIHPAHLGHSFRVLSQVRKSR